MWPGEELFNCGPCWHIKVGVLITLSDKIAKKSPKALSLCGNKYSMHGSHTTDFADSAFLAWRWLDLSCGSGAVGDYCIV